MTKADLVEQVAEAIGPGVTKRDCALVVDGFLNAMKQALVHGEGIEIRGFGSFRVREYSGRTARNPQSGEPVEVPPRSVPVFKPSKLLRDSVTAGPGAADPPPSTSSLYPDDPAFISFPAPPRRGGERRY